MVLRVTASDLLSVGWIVPFLHGNLEGTLWKSCWIRGLDQVAAGPRDKGLPALRAGAFS